MATEREPNLAYMLRLWPVGAGMTIKWRASLQNVSSGERQGFDDIEELFLYLRSVIEERNCDRKLDNSRANS
ncbi:MAG: hypothetical protein ACK2T3_11725 [Candidatus Promineifilaceae bacterium]